MIFIGIDPGKTGGFAVLGAEGELLGRGSFNNRSPAAEVCAALRLYSDKGDLGVILEHVHSMPQQGVATTFEFGRGFGQVEGALTAKGQAYTLVTPRQWQKVLPEGDDAKQRVRHWVLNRWGNWSAFMPPYARTPHQGMMDAAAMAYYGLMLHRGEIAPPAETKRRKVRSPMKI